MPAPGFLKRLWYRILSLFGVRPREDSVMGNANVAQKLWDWLRGVAQKDANQFLYVPIPKQRTNRDYSDQPLRVYRDYFRLWLSEMFLAKSRQWFVNWHPAFHSTVELK